MVVVKAYKQFQTHQFEF